MSLITESTRLDGIPQDLPLYHDRPDIDRFIYLVSISFGTSVRESGAFIPAESHYRLFLYDACHVFQYFDSTLLTSYLTSILKVDSTHTYSLYTYLLPGYVLGRSSVFGGSGGNVGGFVS